MFSCLCIEIEMTQKKHSLIYIVSDFVSAEIAWIVFYNLRAIFIDHASIGFYYEDSLKYWMMLVGMPAAWIFFYFVVGFYRNTYIKSRLRELGLTFNSAMTGSVIVFFFILLNDVVASPQYHYLSFMLFFSVQFIFTYIPRLLITTKTIQMLNSGKIGFKTIIIVNISYFLN